MKTKNSLETTLIASLSYTDLPKGRQRSIRGIPPRFGKFMGHMGHVSADTELEAIEAKASETDKVLKGILEKLNI